MNASIFFGSNDFLRSCKSLGGFPGLGQLINLIVNFYKLTVKLINLT